MTWRAPEIDRRHEPFVADERTMLRGWLDYHRETLLHKCAGLTAEQLRDRGRRAVGLTLLGLVRHMADVERWWFRRLRRPGARPDLYCTTETRTPTSTTSTPPTPRPPSPPSAPRSSWPTGRWPPVPLDETLRQPARQDACQPALDLRPHDRGVRPAQRPRRPDPGTHRRRHRLLIRPAGGRDVTTDRPAGAHPPLCTECHRRLAGEADNLRSMDTVVIRFVTLDDDNESTEEATVSPAPEVAPARRRPLGPPGEVDAVAPDGARAANSPNWARCSPPWPPRRISSSGCSASSGTGSGDVARPGRGAHRRARAGRRERHRRRTAPTDRGVHRPGVPTGTMRRALIIANEAYTDPQFASLPGAVADADSLREVLENQAIGAFDDVRVLRNRTVHDIGRAVAVFFPPRRARRPAAPAHLGARAEGRTR